MGKWKETSFKEAIAIEYLAGGIDQRSLAAKYNVARSAVHKYVKDFQAIKRGVKRKSRVMVRKKKATV